MLPLIALAAAIQVPTDPALTQTIAAREAALFHTFFQECDPPKLATFLAPDFEMYHDRDGKVAGTAQQLVDLYARQCEAKKQPGAWRSRRELVAGALHVDPVPGFGAIEEGDHVFYERQGDGPEKLVGKGHFVQLWQLEPDGEWRLARVLSYKHAAIDNH